MLSYQAGPEKWAAHAETWRQQGADYVSMRAMGAGLASPQAHIDALRAYAEALGVRPA